MKDLYRYILAGLGIVSVAVGIIGIFLPVLPTVPFFILSAFCFSKSSPRLHQWLLERPKYGPIIKDWESHKVIPRRVKVIATVTASPMLVYPFFLKNHGYSLRLFLPACFVVVMIYIWTRSDKKLSS